MPDLSQYYNDISLEQPCGPDLEYDSDRLNLNTLIQGTPEDQFSGQKSEPPNWREVEKHTLALLKRSKDLQVLLYLIRSQIHLEGFSGFRDGLNILSATLTHHWANVYPLLDPDDNDPIQRLNILEELCSWELVLNPLSLSTLVEAKTVGNFSLRDIQYATEKLPLPAHTVKPDLNLIKAAFAEAETAALQVSYHCIQESANLLEQIESLVALQVGGLSNGVNFQAIKSLFKELLSNFVHLAGDRLASDNQLDKGPESDSSEMEHTEKTVKAASHKVGEISSRQDVIKVLDVLCKYYETYEPSSPVPILLKRAKALVNANFMEVLRNLAPDALGQIELIKGPDQNDNN